MALPSAKNLAYRGILSGNAKCIAWRGFFCDASSTWNEIKKFTLTIKRNSSFILER